MIELRSVRYRLYYQGDPPYDRSVVTGEDYCKWYSVFVVSVTGEITETRGDVDSYGDDLMWYSTHIPHPAKVFMWAEKHGYAVDPKFMEAMVESFNLENDRCSHNEIAQIGPNAHRPHVYVRSSGYHSRRLEPVTPLNGYDLSPKDYVTVETEDHKSHEFVITEEIDLLKFLKSKKLWPES